ncbi:gibberellin 2-oxidase 2 [Striga asiatica]|uniref:gibberellin 2beta-dioxygenase n=1 Tax=Striga asiatica TaxID=4170 RepID=A0A5A7QIB8_STRAF|nr:gibberellin 2-oxidase 2 [Striga asiatica]
MEQFPTIDLSEPDSSMLRLVEACEDLGFFKVVNHGVPPELIERLESEAVRFFSLPRSAKDKVGPPRPGPFGYGNRSIGCNGDVGRVEYLLMTADADSDYRKFASVFGGAAADGFRRAVDDYLSAVKKMACEILEVLADGLKVQPREAFSKLLKDEESDSVFRLNRYPPCNGAGESDPIGFGAHTDPQIISVLRSNDAGGLQIVGRDGEWVSVPPDRNCFFINVGDSLQVMTNGRFKSVRHRVVANSPEARLSMIYFGGPPLSEKIAPLPSLLIKDEDSLYKEFTWFDYKKSAYNTRLADNRLGLFEKIAAS